MHVHPAFHDVLGERQPAWSLAAILGFGAGATACLLALGHETFAAAGPWRATLAALLTADITAGCVANATSSTNDYYAARPRHRWTFIAVHVHLPVVALLLGVEAGAALAVWAYTIAAASVVNVLAGRPAQRLVGMLLTAVAIVVLPFVLADDPVILALSLLFVTKVVYAFAVDHTACRRDRPRDRRDQPA